MRYLSPLVLFALIMLGTAFSIPAPDGQVQAATRGGGVVYFNRPASFNGAFLRPVVIIDGRQIGTIASGQCRRLRLPAGHHRIIVRDQRSLLSRFGRDLFPTTVNVWNGSKAYVTIHPLQETVDFNEPAPSYQLLVSDRGRRC